MSKRYYLEKDFEEEGYYDLRIEYAPSQGIKSHSILMEPIDFIDDEAANEIAKRLDAYHALYEACRKALTCASLDSSVRALIVEAIAKADGRASE